MVPACFGRVLSKPNKSIPLYIQHTFTTGYYIFQEAMEGNVLLPRKIGSKTDIPINKLQIIVKLIHPKSSLTKQLYIDCSYHARLKIFTFEGQRGSCILITTEEILWFQHVLDAYFQNQIKAYLYIYSTLLKLVTISLKN